MRDRMLLILLVTTLAGCQLSGISAGVSSDPLGPTFDTASLGPRGGGRTGQAYGKSGRARLRPADTGKETPDGNPQARRARTLSSENGAPANPSTASQGEDVDLGIESAETSPGKSRALPVSAEEPEVLGRSPRPKPVRAIPVEE